MDEAGADGVPGQAVERAVGQHEDGLGVVPDQPGDLRRAADHLGCLLVGQRVDVGLLLVDQGRAGLEPARQLQGVERGQPRGDQALGRDGVLAAQLEDPQPVLGLRARVGATARLTGGGGPPPGLLRGPTGEPPVLGDHGRVRAAAAPEQLGERAVQPAYLAREQPSTSGVGEEGVRQPHRVRGAHAHQVPRREVSQRVEHGVVVEAGGGGHQLDADRPVGHAERGGHPVLVRREVAEAPVQEVGQQRWEGRVVPLDGEVRGEEGVPA